MKRVVNFLVAPLRLISRPVALLVVALLLIGAWGLTAFLQTAQVARDALASLTMSAGAVAASIDMPLEHFADTTDAFRATDFQGDKVALTSRLLRLQGALSPVGATFAVSASGQLLASSSPFSVNDASVADTEWFRHAMGDNAMPVALQRADSWLRTGPSVILSRLVRDTSGRPAGLIGAVLRFEDFDRLIGRTWFGPGVTIELRGVDGVLALPRHDVPSSPPTVTGSESGWSTSLMSTASRLLGIPARLSASAPLRTVDATVTAQMDTDIALRSHWLSKRAIGVLGAYLLAVWVTCIALAVSRRSNSEQPADVPSGFGADWQVELDRRGCITAVHGYCPDRLREGIGQPLLTALGLAPSHKVAEALEARFRQDNIQVNIANEDGQDRVHRLGIEPLPDGRYNCVGRDVTNEARLATKLDAASAASQAAQEEAATVARDRDRVLAAVGHDVRTPMNSIMGICSLLLDSELEQEQRLWLERIRASCEA